MTNYYQWPRNKASTEIKLLRLELLPSGRSPCEEIGSDWSPAQPSENLSPEKASELLGCSIWSLKSEVKKRYKTLQMRFPPDQFIDRHSDWRPAAELLGTPRKRLNWFWQSGLIPVYSENSEQVISSQTVLETYLNEKR